MTTPRSVRRRHVFYVCGFDPNGPGRYHRLFGDGAAQQEVFGGAPIQVGPRERRDGQTVGWRVRHGGAADEAVETDYLFPRWDDVVRDHWTRDFWPQLLALLRTSWLYLRTGALWRMYRQSWLVFITLFAPFFLVMSLLPVWLMLLGGLGWLAHAGWSGQALAPPVAVALVCLAVAAWWSYWARRHWHTRWILRGYGFAGRVGSVGVPALDCRLDAMADAVCRQAQANEDDEILVVGHSLGTAMAVSVLARALRQDPGLLGHGPAIGLLTLGHCTPMLSNLPGATGFRAELALLAQAPDLCWIDYTDALDPYSFHAVDPVAVAGLATARAGHPRLLSPRFDRLFEPGPQQREPMNQHEIHQQYLCASRAGDPYDFFAMVAGPLTLAQRLGRGAL
ncbi:hypothetical protein GT347_06290 [Xylophilus rhododendri]|uniref:Uncharacterized protein n=1 Tax=Xylophilus rhododendri TaxID=2697032 RepID=A0A857J3K7_9BURK|nr:hypothetical protein [Xylophilus rhododendri]QHI97631.1 hypothetical protein GT347_06290 [Xylophilus rhododendri]